MKDIGNGLRGTESPATESNAIGVPDGRTSLRDWFAGMALSGMTADETRSGGWDLYAKDAYDFADAMLAEREK